MKFVSGYTSRGIAKDNIRPALLAQAATQEGITLLETRHSDGISYATFTYPRNPKVPALLQPPAPAVIDFPWANARCYVNGVTTYGDPLVAPMVITRHSRAHRRLIARAHHARRTVELANGWSYGQQ